MSNVSAAKAALRLEETCASACLRAVDILLGDQWLAWEPETLWLDLKAQGVDVPLSNREQILAGRSLITTGAFWWELHAFERTCIAFNNEEPTRVGLEDAPVAFISWAMTEANNVHRIYEDGETLEFDREPTLYMAIQLFREGFLIPPDNMAWLQPELDKLLRADSHLKKLQQAAREGWAAAPRSDKELLDAAFPETPAGVQMARLAAVHVYHEHRKRERAKQLAKFKDMPVAMPRGPLP